MQTLPVVRLDMALGAFRRSVALLRENVEPEGVITRHDAPPLHDVDLKTVPRGAAPSLRDPEIVR